MASTAAACGAGRAAKKENEFAQLPAQSARAAMSPAWRNLLHALRQPEAMASLRDDEWDLVLRQASSAGLLGRLAALARQAGIEASLPAPVRRHFTAALTLSDQQQRAVRWEMEQLAPVLAPLDGPVLLLKGAAYVAAGLPPAPGRLFSDIDLMVPRAQLDKAEVLLQFDGWVTTHHDAYDQRYYRQWMHELPPMMHIQRRTVLDLHHSILPDSARIKTRPDLIIGTAQPMVEHPRFSIPESADLVLHSATHLFHEGEWEHGLRDLADLDALLRHFGRKPGFWCRLLVRAEQLNLGRSLFYGLRYCRMVLSTPMPREVQDCCSGRPGNAQAAMMDSLFLRAFSSAHHASQSAGTGLATWALYMRSHFLRMPLDRLAVHLAVKAWKKALDIEPRSAA